LKVAEIYRSIQGEGALTGTESVFVRTSGCNLRCWFCDTPYASWNPEGEDYSVSEIMEQISVWSSRHVVLTGGEPMLFAELIPLCNRLRAENYHITIETAGTLFLPVECDLMSISPKTANSAPDATEHQRWNRRHERTRFAPHVIKQLLEAYNCQIKFIVDQEDDLDEIDAYIRHFPVISTSQVYLMPQGRTQQQLEEVETWLKPLCLQLNYQYCPRKQIEWFGAVKGT
tara:strand:+ start:834 stop:1520 length:687 start_codon:yes stop_codon:yes gene_type:complete